MATDGRVWDGQLPMSGARFDATFAGHMYDGAHFPDGTNHGPASMTVDHHAQGTMSGRYSGSGDTGTFNMSLSPMWDRPASIGTVAGVYTRTTSNGYTMTMTLDANGQLTRQRFAWLSVQRYGQRPGRNAQHVSASTRR